MKYISRISKQISFIFIVITLLTSCGAAKKARVRESKINTVINTARTYTGVPYKWGGTTRGGMDCSGLLLNSYKSIGIQVPRTSELQSSYGQKVKEKKIQPGDWVFFATGKKKRKITHVGLVTYVKRGTVKFIHASTNLGVVESSMNTEYYQKSFRMARRPF